MFLQHDWGAMSINEMKSLRFAEFGPSSVLRIEEVPEPGEREALVHVKAAAINPSDIGNVSGHFKKTTLPRTPGRDFAGIVAKGKHHEGDEVWTAHAFWQVSGTAAFTPQRSTSSRTQL
jgi:NADPH:quinone reductase